MPSPGDRKSGRVRGIERAAPVPLCHTHSSGRPPTPSAQAEQELRATFAGMGRAPPPPKPQSWDHNVITPGTPFMALLMQAPPIHPLPTPYPFPYVGPAGLLASSQLKGDTGYGAA